MCDRPNKLRLPARLDTGATPISMVQAVDPSPVPPFICPPILVSISSPTPRLRKAPSPQTYLNPVVRGLVVCMKGHTSFKLTKT